MQCFICGIVFSGFIGDECDCSQPGPGPTPPPNHGLFYNFGSQLNSNATFDGTQVQLVMLPVPYDRVRLVLPHFGGSGDGVVKCLVAATDNIGDLSLDNSAADKRWITPERAGVERNVIAEDGWARVTFGGSETATIDDPGPGLTAYATSDWIELDAVPLIGDPYPGYYALLIRFYGSNGGANNYTQATILGGLTNAQYVTDQAPRFMRFAGRGGDHVTTPSGWSQSNTPVLSSGTFLPVIIDADSSTPARSVLFVGDSRFAVASEDTALAYRRTEWYVEKLAVADGVAFTMCTVSQGGYTSEGYHARAMALLATSAVRPEWAVYLIYTTNDGLPDESIINQALSRAESFRSACAARGIKVLFLTAFPRLGGFNSGQLALLDSVETYAASTGSFLSPLDLYGDANGEWASYSYDGNHMTSAGYEDLAGKIWTAIA